MAIDLNLADLAVLLQANIDGDTPPPGTDPFSLAGLRTIDGTLNNLTNLMIVDQYGNLVDTATFANANQPFFNVSNFAPTVATVNPVYAPGLGAAGDIVDTSPRVISNLVVDMSADNPNVAPDAIGNPGAPAFFIPPTNALFTFFGQFFDHGLDFIDKGGNGTVAIPLLPTDPLFDPTPPPGPPPNMMFVSRATLDPTLTDNNSSTAPLVEQSQTYGQLDTTAFYLREYDAVTGLATGRLVTHIDPVTGAESMATWADIKANAALGLNANGDKGIVLLDSHVLDIPDADQWDPITGFPDGTNLGDQLGAGTGQSFLADIAHNAAPTFLAGGVLNPDANDTVDPISPVNFPGSPYDNELLDAHKVAGDGRVNENPALTSIHQAFHGEHNRIVLMLEDLVAQRELVQPGFSLNWTGERLFLAAKFVNEMQYQHFAFEEFARRLSPNIDAFAQYDVTINPNISEEFSQAIYRLGHSMLTDTVAAVNSAGQVDELSLVDAFLNPVAFDELGAGAIIEGQTRQEMNLIDEHVVTSLRNFLVGIPLDLAAINIARGRDVGLPTLNQLREQLFNDTGEGTLAPYVSWADFGANMLHPDALVNFIAAYGRDADLITARGIGDNDAARARAAVLMNDLAFMNGGDLGFWDIDLWLGALAEAKAIGPGGVPSMLGTTADFIFAQQMLALQNGDRLYYLARLAGNLIDQIELSTFGDIFERGTGARHTNGSIFSAADEYVELAQVAGVSAFTSVAGDWMEVIGGTTGVDTINAGAGNDTIWAEDGNDVIDGGTGNDQLNGGDGDDTIHGGSGDDFIRGGAGADTIHGDAGLDHIFGQLGDDIIDAGDGTDEVFGGLGNDTIDGGAQDDALFGNEQDDIVRGGFGNDALDGGSGNDSLSGDNGNDTLLGGAGNDILDGGPGADVLDGGLAGFDVASYANSPVGLTIEIGNPGASTGEATGDTYIDIEAVLGTPFNDGIIGDAFDNIVFGGGGSDFIDGGLGNDTVYDNQGQNDTLIGGGGGFVDQAVFLGRNADAFTNFNINVVADPTDDTITGVSVATGSGTVTEIAGASDTLNGFEQLAFDDGIWSTQSLEWVPLISLAAVGGAAEPTLIVDGVELDGNQVNSAIFLDGATVNPAFGVRVADIVIDDRDGISGGGVRDPIALVGPDAPLFFVNATQDGLFFVGNPGGLTEFNFEAQDRYEVTLSVADASGGSSINYTLNITDVNDNAPLFTSPDQVSVWDTTDTTTVVYRATATDLDTVTDVVGSNLAYSMAAFDPTPVTGNNNDLFGMTDNGEIRFLAAPVIGDYVAEMVATDGANPTTKRAAIRVTEANQAPVFSSPAATSVPENLSVLAAAYIAVAADPDDSQGILPLTYSLDPLVGDNALFNIDSLTGELFFVQSPDFENPLDAGENNVYNVSITASDGVVSSTQAVAVTVTDIPGDATINGTPGNDIITPLFTSIAPPTSLPTAGADTINGEAGVDVLDGGDGNDIINGGPDTDVLFGGNGNDTLNGDGGDDTLDGGAGDDILNGGDDNDILAGGAGNDSFNGGAGDDLLLAETNDLSFVGGTGFDRLQIQNTDAFIFSMAGTGIDRVNGNAGNDIVDATGVATTVLLGGLGGNDTLTGGDGDDGIAGGTGNDILNGGGGADAIFGEAGNDTLVGGAGDDLLFGETNDLSFSGGTGFDALFIQNTDAFIFSMAGTGIDRVNANDGNDVIDAVGVATDVVLSGNNGNDILTAGDGNDIIAGGAGIDTVEGGAGSDSLFGGLDADTFVFNIGSGIDIIADWENGSDLIDFSTNANVNVIGDLTITDVGLNATVEFDGGNTITVLNAAGQIEASDFAF